MNFAPGSLNWVMRVLVMLDRVTPPSPDWVPVRTDSAISLFLSGGSLSLGSRLAFSQWW